MQDFYDYYQKLIGYDLLPKTEDYNIYFGLNFFFNQFTAPTRKKICKIIYDKIKTRSTQIFGETLLMAEDFNEKKINDILYMFLYWETTNNCILTPLSCSLLDKKNKSCTEEIDAFRSVDIGSMVQSQNDADEEYQNVYRPDPFSNIITNMPTREVSLDDYNQCKQVVSFNDTPFCLFDFDEEVFYDDNIGHPVGFTIKKKRCDYSDCKNKPDVCRLYDGTCLVKAPYGYKSKDAYTWERDGAIYPKECMKTPCQLYKNFMKDGLDFNNYTKIGNYCNNRKTDEGNLPVLDLLALNISKDSDGDFKIQDYYENLGNSKKLFYYGLKSTSNNNDLNSPNDRYRLDFSKNKNKPLLQCIKSFRIVYNLLKKSNHKPFLNDNGVFSIKDSEKNIIYASFDLGKSMKNSRLKSFIKLHSKGAQEYELKIDIDTKTKQRFLSPSGLFFLEYYLEINRISIYFNIFNSSVFCYLWLDSDRFPSKLQKGDYSSEIFNVYKKYDLFCTKNKWFKNYQGNICFNADQCADLVLPPNQIDNVKRTKAFDSLYCVTKECVQSPYNTISADMSVTRLLYNECPEQIKICISTFNAENSTFDKVTFKTSCGECDDRNCADGYKCVDGLCQKNIPPDGGRVKKKHNHLVLIISIISGILFSLILFLIIFFIYKKKNESKRYS